MHIEARIRNHPQSDIFREIRSFSWITSVELITLFSLLFASFFDWYTSFLLFCSVHLGAHYKSCSGRTYEFDSYFAASLTTGRNLLRGKSVHKFWSDNWRGSSFWVKRKRERIGGIALFRSWRIAAKRAALWTHKFDASFVSSADF